MDLFIDFTKLQKESFWNFTIENLLPIESFKKVKVFTIPV
jgi:hypothetical protein